MAIKLFDSPVVSFNDLPWLNDYVEENPKCVGKFYSIESVTLSSKGTGYLFKTDTFIAFEWKKSRNVVSLIEAIIFYSVKGEGPALGIVPNKQGKAQFAMDDELSCFFKSQNGTWYISLSPISREEDIPSPLNPFLRESDAQTFQSFSTTTQETKKRSKASRSSLKASPEANT